MIDLAGLSSPGLSHLVIDLTDLFDHLIRSMPFGKKLTCSRWDEDKDQLPWLKLTDFGIPVVDTGLSLLSLLHMVSHDRPDLSHPLLHNINMLYDRAVR